MGLTCSVMVQREKTGLPAIDKVIDAVERDQPLVEYYVKSTKELVVLFREVEQPKSDEKFERAAPPEDGL